MSTLGVVPAGGLVSRFFLGVDKGALFGCFDGVVTSISSTAIAAAGGEARGKGADIKFRAVNVQPLQHRQNGKCEIADDHPAGRREPSGVAVRTSLLSASTWAHPSMGPSPPRRHRWGLSYLDLSRIRRPTTVYPLGFNR